MKNPFNCSFNFKDKVLISRFDLKTWLDTLLNKKGVTNLKILISNMDLQINSLWQGMEYKIFTSAGRFD